MRLVIGGLVVLLFIGLIWFGVTNAGTKTTFQVANTAFSDFPLSLLVTLSVILGFLFASVIAFTQNARVRYDNRRLLREIRQAETEIHYLRTQPTPSSLPEAATPEMQQARRVEIPQRETRPASAPVYGPDDEWSDPDDEVYSSDRVG
jgi:uncharacterized membrane protein YciS (DUF1049 family)